MARHRLYTDEVIAKIRAMQKAGADASEIAMVIGTTPKRLRSRLHQLGLTRKFLALDAKIPVRGSASVLISYDVIDKFTAPAHARKLLPQQLVRLVLMRIAKENLFTAILDDGL